MAPTKSAPSRERSSLAPDDCLTPMDLYTRSGSLGSRDRISAKPWEDGGWGAVRKSRSDTAALRPCPVDKADRVHRSLRTIQSGALLAPTKAEDEIEEGGGDDAGLEEEEGDAAGPMMSEVSQPQSAAVRRNSQQAFAEKLHTTLVLDWDDTLFPTTWVREDCRLDWRLSLDAQVEPGDRREAIRALLGKHLVRAEAFFSEAAAYANIFIVTLAKRPWVENSMEKFMPELARIVKQHCLKVIYAQEFADEQEVAQYMTDCTKSAEEGTKFWTRVKGDAIAKELGDFHRLLDASWKNVISFGDSDFERYGTLLAGQDYMRREMEGGSVVQTGHTAEGVSRDGHFKRLRVKTVKMLEKPTVLELTAELALLRLWLPHIVRRDSGFDLEIDCTDDDTKLVDLHRLVTGEEDPTLSWQQLAGMIER